ncbi:MAG: hypothetical protein J0G30_07295 [Actinomycetales bacterium]|nr:hypothetical protein [Actinomycetales bacterium]
MGSSFEVVEHAGTDWTFEFVDEAIWLIQLDYAVSLVTQNLQLRIERSFELRRAKQHFTIVPNSPQDLVPVLSLHEEPLRRVVVAESGELRMHLRDGETILVPPSDDAYEAFTLSITGDFNFASLPGGGLDYWGAMGRDAT